MPRRRQKTGTRRNTVLRRQQRNTKNARLIAGVRRFGGFAALAVFFMWVGAWIYLSGTTVIIRDRAIAAFHQVSAESGFIVEDILVEGRVNTDRDLLLGLIGVDRGDPLFAFDPGAAQKRLEQVSWIESVRVERHLPGLVYVAISERRPFAMWQYQGKLSLIDSGGFVISDTAQEMAPFKDLPLVVGAGADAAAHDLLILLAAEPKLDTRMAAAIYVGTRRWDIKLRNGIEVKLPEGDIALALRRLAVAQERDGLLDKEIESIDLRESGRIVVQTKPGAVQDYKASYQAGSPI